MKNKNKKNILTKEIIFGFLFIALFCISAKISNAAYLTNEQCSASGGTCNWISNNCNSDETAVGLCQGGTFSQGACCKKTLQDTSGADPDPIGAGIGAGGTLQDPNATPGPGSLGSGAKGGTVTPGTSGIPTTSPTTANSTANIQSVPNGGLVPCGLGGAADCTLCHLVLGFKNIYDYLLVLLLSATTLVVVAAGVMYMVSSGDKGMIDKAKSALTYAITAMILALTAWLIINATLHALGYKNAGSWYNFTCDTAQTQGPTGGVGGGTLPGTGGGSGSYKASGYLSPKAQEVINNYMNTQVGKNYGGDVHCYSTTDAAYTLSGLQDLGGRWKAWDGDPSSIKPGDAMQTSKHTWLVMENGATSNAIPGGKIGVNPDGLNYNLNKAKNLGLQVRIIHVN